MPEESGKNSVRPTKAAVDNVISSEEDKIQSVQNPEISDSVVNAEINRIEAFFEKALKSGSLKLKPADFSLPEVDTYGKNKKKARKIWYFVKDRYENSIKSGKIDIKPEKFKSMLLDLKIIESLCPGSECIKRHIAFISVCADKQSDALKIYKTLSWQTKYVSDSRNATIVALYLKEYEIAFRCFEDLFRKSPIADDQDMWSVMMHAALYHNGMKILKDIFSYKLSHIEEEDPRLFFESLVYILVKSGSTKAAEDMVSRRIKGESSESLSKEALLRINFSRHEISVNNTQEERPVFTCERPVPEISVSFLDGHITQFNSCKGYGFITSLNGSNLFFHKNDIIDDELMEMLNNGDTRQIPVVYDSIRGYRGLAASKIRYYRTDDELYQFARKTADEGEYKKAIAHMEKLLTVNPQFRDGRDLVERWREYECMAELPRGKNRKAMARSAQLVKKIPEPAETIIKIDENQVSHQTPDISKFTRFFLDNCRYHGVSVNKVMRGRFNTFDIENLEFLASHMGRAQSRMKAGYFLSAAKIYSLLNENYCTTQFYRYLYYSFTSSGDAIVSEGKQTDSARDLYCEALSLYDRLDENNPCDQDADNILIKYLYSTFGIDEVRTELDFLSISECLEYVMKAHLQYEEVFEAISYVTSYSCYATKKIFESLFNRLSNRPYKAMAIDFLKQKCGLRLDPALPLRSFLMHWELLHQQIRKNRDSIHNECGILRTIELTVESITSAMECVKRLSQELYLKLDHERAGELFRIFEVILDLCRQKSFKEKEKLCAFAEKRCREFLQEIELYPTRFSADQLNGVVQKLVEKLKPLC